MTHPETPASPSPPPADAPKKKSKSPVVLIVLIAGCVLSVPCIGVLSAIAIPAFVQYTRRAKVAEAEANLRSMQAGVMHYCEANGRLPGATSMLPAVPGPEKQVADFSSDPGFAAIDFGVSDPVYYGYQLRPELDGSLSILAQGDLDGDGILSRFSVRCEASCVCGTMLVEDELE